VESFLGEQVEDSPGKTHSDRKARKMNALKIMFGSKYRHPDNRQTLMGQEQTLGKAFAIMPAMMYGPSNRSHPAERESPDFHGSRLHQQLSIP
jgi:hypothetical protein